MPQCFNWLIRITGEPAFHLCKKYCMHTRAYILKKFIAWKHCKSLWIKASAKCINVNTLLESVEVTPILTSYWSTGTQRRFVPSKYKSLFWTKRRLEQKPHGVPALSLLQIETAVHAQMSLHKDCENHQSAKRRQPRGPLCLENALRNRN